jgi:hypothetical protein
MTGRGMKKKSMAAFRHDQKGFPGWSAKRRLAPRRRGISEKFIGGVMAEEKERGVTVRRPARVVAVVKRHTVVLKQSRTLFLFQMLSSFQEQSE